MSRHVARHERWDRLGTDQYRSLDGLIVRRRKGEWWAEVVYQLLVAAPPAGEAPGWEAHHERLGPFRRPRNAMVEAERHATLLRNRHGERVRFGGASDSPAGT
jgi:hypothetical protein